MDGRPDFRSADGRFLVEYGCAATVGNHWICQPRLTDVPAGAVLLDLWGAATWDWDCDRAEAAGPVVSLSLRRFPGSTACVVDVDADRRTYAIRDATRAGKGLDALREALRHAGLAESPVRRNPPGPPASDNRASE